MLNLDPAMKNLLIETIGGSLVADQVEALGQMLIPDLNIHDLSGKRRNFTLSPRMAAQVLTEHLGDDQEIETKDRILTDVQIHDRDMDWVRESDLVVAEVTIPSLGVGYEIGRAIELGKPVLSLFKKGSGFYLSAMIGGSEGVSMVHYEHIGELADPLEMFISERAPRRTS